MRTCEGEAAPRRPVIERRLPVGVARQTQAPGRGIPARECPVPAASRESLICPALPRPEQDHRVGQRGTFDGGYVEGVTECLPVVQARPAGEDRAGFAVEVRHDRRLILGRGDEARMAQAGVAAADPDAAAVRPPVLHGLRHPRQVRLHGRLLRIDQAKDAAHDGREASRFDLASGGLSCRGSAAGSPAGRAVACGEFMRGLTRKRATVA